MEEGLAAHDQLGQVVESFAPSKVGSLCISLLTCFRETVDAGGRVKTVRSDAMERRIDRSVRAPEDVAFEPPAMGESSAIENTIICASDAGGSTPDEPRSRTRVRRMDSLSLSVGFFIANVVLLATVSWSQIKMRVIEAGRPPKRGHTI